MKIYSFAQDSAQMIPVEVELSLIPGLPQTIFTGLPDTAIKESIMRIKSAVRSQGFEWPKTRQVVINLRPSYLKKRSQGLDLAIACALLWKTGQMKAPTKNQEKMYIYGELSLEGAVSLPADWENLPACQEGILTGPVDKENYLCPLLQIDCLKNLDQAKPVPLKSLKDLIKAPELSEIYFSEPAAKLLTLCAVGEHSLMLAGPSGSGKSTLADQLPLLLKAPNLKEFSESRKIWASFGESLNWRPFVSPHHSTTALAMIGGGFPLFFGEITKAHGGILFMDEYLEFHPRVQEALREPMEKGDLRIVRKGKSQNFPARFMLIAATNLCPCGDLTPGKNNHCGYSLRRCFSHLDRLNGPMLDRFDVLSFSNEWKGPSSTALKTISEKVKKAVVFREKRKQTVPNSRLDLDFLENSLASFIKNNHLSFCVSSKRRSRAVLRTARTLADMEESQDIQAQHIDQAKHFAFTPFVKIKNRDGCL